MKITKIRYRPSVDNDNLISIIIEVGSYDSSNYSGYGFGLDKNLENTNFYNSYIVVEIYFRPKLRSKIFEILEEAKLMVMEYLKKLNL